MRSQEELHLKISRLIDAGRLPGVRQRHHISAGTGEGSPCDVCGRLITRDAVQYDVEYAVQDEARSARVHVDCYDAWRESVSEI